MKPFQALFISLSASLTLISTSLSALPEFIPIQEKAQGHSLTGANQLNDSLYTNPAASSFTQVYALEGTYAMPKTYAVSILDTKTSEVGGAFGYFRTKLDNSSDPFQGFKVAFAGRVSDTVGTGLGGKILWGPNSEGVNTHLNDLDFGTISHFGIFQTGVTLRNILGGNASIKQYREWSIGARAGYEDTLFLNVSAVSKWENLHFYQYGIGAEYVSPYFFSIKGGYRTQPDPHFSFWSAGVSFISPKFSLHYAIEFPQQQGSKTEHTISATLLF